VQASSERCPLHVNIIIYSELLIPGPDVRMLDTMLDVYETLRTPIPWAAAPLAAAAYAVYRRRGGSKQKPLPDFYVGAHAAVSNLSVLTRDPRPYRSYFARLEASHLRQLALTPNPSLEPTRYGRQRKAGLRPRRHFRSPALRRLPTRAPQLER
jgi:predicted nucleic acid-binding protein